MHRHWYLAAIVLLIVACSSSTPSGNSSGGHGGKGGGSSSAAQGGMGPGGSGGIMTGDAGNPTDILSLVVSPATASLSSVDGSMPTQTFSLLAVQRNGQMVPLATGTWSPSQDFLGAVAVDSSTGNATFTANGIAGGVAPITASAVGFGGTVLKATAMVTVQVQRTIVTPGAPSGAGGTFAGATPDPTGTSAQILYPLDRAFMPNNVAPIDVQWAGGAAGDLYRVTLATPHASVMAYVQHSGAAFTYDWAADAASWRTIAESDPGQATTVSVDLLHSATNKLTAGTPVNIRIAQGSLYGQVYYWAINQGRLQTIAADTAARSSVMPNPPTGCVACHTISRDGRYLGASLDGNPRQITVFDLTDTKALAASPAQSLFTPSLAEVFGTFNQDGTLLLTSGYGSAQGGGDGNDGFTLLKVATGAVAPSTGLPTDQHVTHPDWSPDGKSVVYVGNTAGATQGYYSHYTSGDVFVMPVTGGSTPAFGAPNMLHHGAAAMGGAEGGTADAHPTFSPDSALVAFQHGQVAYSQFNPYGALYVVAASGGAPVRLDNANGGATGTSAFWPTFSPFTTSENGATFYWLAFFSQRDYGNAQVGTKGSGRRQLWVTAVRAGAGAGDPSSVPYWLPGQDTTSENAAARWAPTACRANAASCQVSSECCSGSCLPDPNGGGGFVCQAPPAGQCHTTGQLCGGASDCCAGLACTGNVCGPPPPH